MHHRCFPAIDARLSLARGCGRLLQPRRRRLGFAGRSAAGATSFGPGGGAATAAAQEQRSGEESLRREVWLCLVQSGFAKSFAVEKCNLLVAVFRQ